MDSFHPANAPPPADLADRFVDTVLSLHPDWAEHLSSNEHEKRDVVFSIPGSAQVVEIAFNVAHPGEIVVAWPGGHLHFGFDWHVQPSVEKVTRDAVLEVEQKLLGDGEQPAIISIFPSAKK